MATYRCEKADQAGGGGCVSPLGHKGRCKVREGARAIFAAGGEAPPPSRRAKRRDGGLGGLVDLTRRIRDEVRGLAADVPALVAALDTFGQAVRWDEEFPDADPEP